MSFTKYDDGKLKYSLLPISVLKGVVKVFMFGALKYAPNNYLKCEDPSRYFDAAVRHLIDYQDGEYLNTEELNGKKYVFPHLDQAITNLMILRKLTEEKYNGQDTNSDNR